MRRRRAAAVLGVAFGATWATGCQSTQDKSAEIAAGLGPVRQEKGLKITEASEDIAVVSKTLLTDANGSAVAIELRNESARNLADVPIALNVLDRRGRSVYRNNIPGIEPALASLLYLPAGETATWVHNQILATGEPDAVEVRVGATDATYDRELPDIEVSQPELERDPVSGVAATGVAINHTEENHKRLLLYGVAREGDEIVAAGRGALEEMKPEKRLHYDVFFIGDPEGAELEVTSYPTLGAS